MRVLRVAELMRGPKRRSVAAQRQHGLSRLALRVNFVSSHEEEQKDEGEAEEGETVNFRQKKTAGRSPPFVVEIDEAAPTARSPAAAAHHDTSGARDAARGAW